MVDNLLNEDGSRPLLESGVGIFLESYVPPEDLITSDILVGDPVVNAVLRANTPKYITVDAVVSSPVVTLGSMISSPPAKTIDAVGIVVGDVTLTFAVAPGVVTPRTYLPVRHYIWVHGLRGNMVDCIA